MQLLQKIKNLSKDIYPKLIEIRRYIHQNPELSFQEYQTSKYVCSILDEFGIPYQHGIVKTGIVALIKGKNPDKKTILLRADLDALPIEEKNQKPYTSVNKGVMHACGHDVHTASVLGAAYVLNQLKEDFEGTVKIMFQPGEEVLPGGASLMIKEGVLDHPKVSQSIAQHVFPSMEVGKVGFREGMYMASTDEIHITITGKGGHAAMPADYINPLISAAFLINRVMNEISTHIDEEGLSRSKENNIPTVIAFGKIEGKGATNVIPDKVDLAGTIRTMNEEWRKEVKNRLHHICKEIEQTQQVSIAVNIIDGYPFLSNHAGVTQQCKQAAIEYLGAENVEELPLRMTAEDFAYITQQVPSCFYRLGTGNKAKGITSGVHTATFDVDENVFEISGGLMAWMAIKQLR